MEFLTDHLFALNVTSEECMQGLSSEEQHNNFARQLSALEKLLLISHSRLALDELHKRLKLVLKAGPKGMLKISSLNSLQECVGMYKRSRGVSPQEGEEVSEFFEKFIEEVHFLTKTQQFFHQTIYHCLYEKFYDAILDDSEDEFPTELESDTEDENVTAISRETAPSIEPSCNSEAGSQTVTPNKSSVDKLGSQKSNLKKSKASKDRRVVRKKKRVDNRLKVLQEIEEKKAKREMLLANQKLDEPKHGAEFEALRNKSNNQRLSIAVKRIYQIQAEWRRMMTSGPIDISNFDADNLNEVKRYKNYNPFEAVFRLVPDLLVKGFKLVELSKVWYNSFRRLHGPDQVIHKTATFFEEQIGQFDKSARSVEQLMEKKRNVRDAKQKERRLVLNQLMRLDQLKDKHHQCVEREKELKEYYKQLKQERNAEYPRLEGLHREDTEYREVYDQIQYLAEKMKNVYRELQTASYELALIKQDFNVELGHRTQLIHQQSDIKQMISDVDNFLTNGEQQRLKYLRISEKINENCSRMRRALYPKMLIDTQDKVSTSKHDKNVINKNTFKTSSLSDNSLDDDEAVVDKAIENAIEQLETEEREMESTTPITPLAPVYPVGVSTSNPVVDRKPNRRFNPTSSGLTDKNEAKEYNERVKRLNKGIDLDFSALKVVADCEEDEEAEVIGELAVESGEEGDMESDEELMPRPQSKKYHKRSQQRYSPLSDVSDEYIYRQPYPLRRTPVKDDYPSETVYILKKSVPKKIAKRPPQLVLPPSDEDDNVNLLMIDTLSMYKRTPMTMKASGLEIDTLTPLLPLEHTQGVFTPHRELSDGDISEDSGTGNSLDSENENKLEKSAEKKSSDEGSEYRHKSRIPVREQLQAINKPVNNKPKATLKPSTNPPKTKLPQPLPVSKGVKKVELPTQQDKKALRPVEDPAIKSIKPLRGRHNTSQSPVPYTSTVFSLSPTVVGDRHTLLMHKPAHPLKVLAKPTKPNKIPPRTVPVVELPRKKVVTQKPVFNVKRLPKNPHKQTQISPRRMTMPIQILESPSDSETNEIFRQRPVVISTVNHKRKPVGNRNLPPVRGKRNNGIRSLGKVQ